MTSHTTPKPPDDDRLPESLAALLRERYSEPEVAAPSADEPGVEQRVDEAVRVAAAETLGAITPPRPLRFPVWARTIGGITVAAAAVGITVWLGPSSVQSPPAASPAPSGGSELAAAEPRLMDGRSRLDEAELFAPETLDAFPEPSARVARLDVQPARTVTIRDAYLLALALDRGDEVDTAWDANRDGRVDTADTDALAALAVRLEPGDRLGAFPTMLGMLVPPALYTWSVTQ